MTPKNENPLTNSAGFSLIQVLLGVALLMGLSMAMTTMLTTSMKAVSYSEARMEQTELLRSLQTTLSDKLSCERNFKNLQLNNSNSLNISKIVDRNGTSVVKPNEYVGNRSLRVKSIEVKNKNVPSGGGVGDVELLVSLEKAKSVLGSKESFTTIGVKVTTDSSMKITECFSIADGSLPSTMDLSCKQLGGSFDTITNTCNFSSDCTNIDDNKPISGKCVKLLIATIQTVTPIAGTNGKNGTNGTSSPTTIITGDNTVTNSAPVDGVAVASGNSGVGSTSNQAVNINTGSGGSQSNMTVQGK